MDLGGISTNEILIVGAVAGGAYLLYNLKGATDDFDAALDDNGCPSQTSAASVAGMVAEPWAYTQCFANTIANEDYVKDSQDFDTSSGNFIDTSVQDVAVAIGVSSGVQIGPNVQEEKQAQTSDFQAWLDYTAALAPATTSLPKILGDNPYGLGSGVDPYGCVDTMWLPPLSEFGGKQAIVGKVCNDNSGCYQEAYGTNGKTISDWGKLLDSGMTSCAVAADNNTLAILDVSAVKANPTAIPLPGDMHNSLQSQFGVSFADITGMVNPNWKPPPKGFQGYQSVPITVGNINSVFGANPMDNPSAPVPPGGWK